MRARTRWYRICQAPKLIVNCYFPIYLRNLIEVVKCLNRMVMMSAFFKRYVMSGEIVKLGVADYEAGYGLWGPLLIGIVQRS